MAGTPRPCSGADQALPSAGLSSSILVAKALRKRQFPESAVKACVLINLAPYHLAYAVALLPAIGILEWRHRGNPLISICASPTGEDSRSRLLEGSDQSSFLTVPCWFIREARRRRKWSWALEPGYPKGHAA